MKQISALYLGGADHSLADLSIQLNSRPRHRINHVPWPAYPCKPEVSFAIAYNDQYIFLKYFVLEKYLRAKTSNINGSVWEDSCVEFFISFDNRGYYNLEFNCLGVALAGFGKDKSSRELISENLISNIRTETLIIRQNSGSIHWELLLSIPLNVFVYHPLSSISGKQCRANFYKCGDLLPEPHYLSWTDISSHEPNFHLPQFFGSLHFE